MSSVLGRTIRELTSIYCFDCMLSEHATIKIPRYQMSFSTKSIVWYRRMRPRSLVAATVIAQLSSPVMAADESVCNQLFSASASIVSNKQMGRNESELKAALPPKNHADSDVSGSSNQAYFLFQLYEMVDEVYAGATPDQFAYSVYRTEKCHREISGLWTPGSFEDVRENLAKCSQMGQQAAINCAMKAAGSQP